MAKTIDKDGMNDDVCQALIAAEMIVEAGGLGSTIGGGSLEAAEFIDFVQSRGRDSSLYRRGHNLGNWDNILCD